MLADILYGLLITLTVLAVIGVFRMARHLRRSSDTPTERLLVMTLVILGMLAVLFFFFNGQLNDYRTSNGGGKKTDQQLFVEKVYLPLAQAQSQLDYQLQQLAILQERIFDLSRNHPQQAGRLELAYNTWKYERQGLTQLKLKVDRAVRIAMGVQKLSDKSYIENTFNREAVDWEKIISDRLSLHYDSQLKVTNAMIDNVILQNRELSNIRGGKNNAFLTASGTQFKSEFDPKTVTSLLEYLEKTAPNLAETLTSIGQEVSSATQKRREARNYSLENPDLEPVFRKVIEGWFQLENKGLYYRDQLLHAIQAEYLAVLLGTNKNDNQIIRLKKSIAEQAKALYDDLYQSRVTLEKSYRTAPR